ncbi:hypothetical protein DFQ29_003791 [Apophysomyces sp. BC1021]|nr:hypothetical protein DFQ29_003791 [Apophysomyces sp. BC1021]
MLVASLVILFFFALVNASLFSSSNPYISEVSVTIYSNTSSINTIDESDPPRNYKQNIVPNTNLTQPETEGRSGILYDRGLSCSSNSSGISPPALLKDQQKIALVRRGECSFTTKVINCQQDNAIAVIIYDDVPFEKDSRAGIMDIPATNISIAVYYVDLDVGVDLLGKLQLLSSSVMQAPDNVSYQKAIKVILYPAIGGFPNAWEFTLIVVVALLAISFLTSIGMHWHLWRIRRRQRTLFEDGFFQGNMPFSLQPKKNVIDPALLVVFPTRVVKEPSATDAISQLDEIISKKDSLPDSVISTRQCQAEGLAKEETATFPDVNTGTGPSQVASTGDTSSGDEEDDDALDSCVICLDSFSAGDAVRRLPCDHEYHCECIDPWLTRKSASCPICKHDCSLDIPKSQEGVPDVITASAINVPEPALHSNHSNNVFSFSFLRSFERSGSPHSTVSSFGPTIPADRAEQFSRSWMARSLPRNMRRQLNAVAANQESAMIELPARMTGSPSIEYAQQTNLSTIPLDNANERGGIFRRLSRSLPRYWGRQR